MTNKRGRYGDGTIDQRGPESWRLRYVVNGKRFSETIKGTKKDARKKLRDLLNAADDNTHVEPAKLTLASWIDKWLSMGAPGHKQKQITKHSLERYHDMLKHHIVPTLGERPIQKIQSDEIDSLYVSLKGRISDRTALMLHTVLGKCLAAAVRQRKLAISPMAYLLQVPSPEEKTHGTVLDNAQLHKLIDGFRNSVLYEIVCVAAFTGARRNEILALRWSDLDPQAKTLRIERSVEITRDAPLAFKSPKTERGKRTIVIGDDLIALLLALREKHLRIAAGVSDDAAVDLSLIKLPPDALMFPAARREFSFTTIRDPNSMTMLFIHKARRLGFAGLRFHDLRGTHATTLLDEGVPVHTVAARLGHDPAILLRAYAKKTRKGDASAAGVIGALSKGILGR
jgi:integrase